MVSIRIKKMTAGVEHDVMINATRVQGTPFAIHKSVGRAELWTLTHVPTGWRVFGGGFQKPLRAMAKELATLPTSGTADPDLIKADKDAWVAIIRKHSA